MNYKGSGCGLLKVISQYGTEEKQEFLLILRPFQLSMS